MAAWKGNLVFFSWLKIDKEMFHSSLQNHLLDLNSKFQQSWCNYAILEFRMGNEIMQTRQNKINILMASLERSWQSEIPWHYWVDGSLVSHFKTLKLGIHLWTEYSDHILLETFCATQRLGKKLAEIRKTALINDLIYAYVLYL